MQRDTYSRSTYKSISWRVVASCVTFLLVLIWTDSISIALSITAVEIVVKLTLFIVHERVWCRIAHGRGVEKPAVLWFTGLSGAGKTTIARQLEAQLRKKGLKVAWLDGDVIREYFPQTGFSKEERSAHILRAGFIAKMLEESGITVLVSYISPYREIRQKVREMCNNFIEVHIATPFEECERRDVKGLYAKVRKGEIKQFTGVDDPYEAPENPELRIDTTGQTVDQSSGQILEYLRLN